ncbi:unnamed protein product [Calypogeia fissa]
MGREERAPVNSLYGRFFDFDDSMTLLPDPSSEEIGRGRGMYLCDTKDTKGASVEYVWTAQFNEASGHGDGTTMSFKGFCRYTEALSSKISIVGGTRMLRMARGWADTTTYSLVWLATAMNVTVYFTNGY